jgi:hypothetical protein
MDYEALPQYNVYITNQFQTIFSQVSGGSKIPLAEVTVNSKDENSQDFCPNYVQGFGLRRQSMDYGALSQPTQGGKHK